MINRPSFINNLDWELLVKKYKSENKLKKVIKKIEKDYPIQYLIGDVEFLNTKIIVNHHVLIPRFETELLVANLIDYIKKYDLSNNPIIDLCTGSGCIAIALKKKFDKSIVYAVDKSYTALHVAKKNAKGNGVKIKYLKKDVLKNLKLDKKFSILVSNPPYVKEGEIVTNNTKYEPQIALYPGKDDILFYKKILELSKKILYKKNIIAFEIGSTQAKDICQYAKKIYNNAIIKVVKDYSGFDRFVFIFNNCE